MPRHDLVVSVDLTPAQIAAVDSTAQEVVASGSPMYLVPRAVQVYKPAGQGYTIGAGARLEVIDEATYPNVHFSVPLEGLLDQTTAKRRLILASRNAFIEKATGVKIRASGAITVIADAAATAVLGYTNGTNASDGHKIVVAGTTYTFKTTVADFNQIAIGASADATAANFANALTLGSGAAGSAYLMPVGGDPNVTCVASAPGDTLTFTARANYGKAGNKWGLTTTWTGASVTTSFETNATGVDTTSEHVLISLYFDQYPLIG